MERGKAEPKADVGKVAEKGFATQRADETCGLSIFAEVIIVSHGLRSS